MGNPKVRTVVISGRQSRAITTAGMHTQASIRRLARATGEANQKDQIQSTRPATTKPGSTAAQLWKRFPCKRRIRGRIGQMMQTDRKATAQKPTSPNCTQTVSYQGTRSCSDDWPNRIKRERSDRSYPPQGSEGVIINSAGIAAVLQALTWALEHFQGKIDQGY